MESNPPLIQSYAWHVAKDTAFAAEYEDAFHVGLEHGRAAIADGVSSAIFSGRWARILTKRLVEDPPDISQSDGWTKWLAEPRRLWLEDIDFPRMPIHQKNKLRQAGGAFCTLCWIEFLSLPDSDDGVRRCRLRSFALGDSCLLHIRSGQLLRSFPLTESHEFGLDPDSVCSVATSRDGQQRLATTELECIDGDVIVLVTDAIGDWMLASVENGNPAPWEQLWTLDEAEWTAAIEQLRDANIMKRDDTTMVVLQVGDGDPVWSRPQPTLDENASPSSIEEEPNELEIGPNQEAEPLVVFAEVGGGDPESADGNHSSDIHDDCGIEDRSETHLESANGENTTVIPETVSAAIDDDSGLIGA